MFYCNIVSKLESTEINELCYESVRNIVADYFIICLQFPYWINILKLWNPHLLLINVFCWYGNKIVFAFLTILLLNKYFVIVEHHLLLINFFVGMGIKLYLLNFSLFSYIIPFFSFSSISIFYSLLLFLIFSSSFSPLFTQPFLFLHLWLCAMSSFS